MIVLLLGTVEGAMPFVVPLEPETSVADGETEVADGETDVAGDVLTPAIAVEEG